MTPEEIKQLFRDYGLNPQKAIIFEPYRDPILCARRYRFEYYYGGRIFDWNILVTDEQLETLRDVELFLKSHLIIGIKECKKTIRLPLPALIPKVP